MIAEYHPVPSTSAGSTQTRPGRSDVEEQRVVSADDHEPIFSAFAATYAHWLVSPPHTWTEDTSPAFMNRRVITFQHICGPWAIPHLHMFGSASAASPGQGTLRHTTHYIYW